MDAFGVLSETLVWCFGWAWGATRLARRRFNEGDARRGGLPGRVWAALVVAWLWPALLVADFWVNLTLWPVFAVGPAGMLIVVLEVILKSWNHRYPA